MFYNLKEIKNQKGRIAIVTGANSGLGYEVTKNLAGYGMKVVMACRSMERAEKAREKILKELPEADIDIMVIDVSSLESVREFAEEYKKKYKKVDVLINNAGIMFVPYRETADGYESTFETNYLGHFLLTALLIDMMPDDSTSRVVSLSSIAHYGGYIKLSNLMRKDSYTKWGSYAQSKLACLMFSRELDRRLKASGRKISAVAAHPGISTTPLWKNLSMPVKVLYYVFVHTLFQHSPKKAAVPATIAAVYPELKGGEYIGPIGPLESWGYPGDALSSPISHNKKTWKRLWEESEKLTGVQFKI